MTPVEFMLLAFAASVGAGVFGALLGLGGGIIVVPALTLLLGVDIRYAIGASIVSVIATSSGAGAAYVRDRLANIRIAMLLESATTLGALAGAFLSGVVSHRWLYLIFGLVMAYAATGMWRGPRPAREAAGRPDRLTARLRLDGTYFDGALGKEVPYRASHAPRGLASSSLAGVISGLLGVGGGVIQVPAMNLVMGLPLKISTATSNFMIGVTAATSAGIYFQRGDINPFIAGPVALGVITGAVIGARLMRRLRSNMLRAAFTLVLVGTAVEMIWKGLR
jgi:uncharacterized protein